MNAPFIGPVTQDESKEMRVYYIIYSIDLTRDGERLLNDLDPNRVPRHTGESISLAGRWYQTEGDEQYDYDYLADEMGDREGCRACNGSGGIEERFITVPRGWVGVGIVDRWSSNVLSDTEMVTELRPCERCGGSGNEGSRYKKGWHRKWVGELTHPEFLMLAKDRCWELDDDDRPQEFTDTMGSITEYGHLPAIAIEDDEGWCYGGEIISAQFYVTMGELPLGFSEPINESEGA